MARLRTHLAALGVGISLALTGGPASALERLVLRMPFLETQVTINLAAGQSAEQLIQASPDLQDLELASGGKLLPLLRQVFLTPLPLETKSLLAGSTGQPLLEQALHAATQLVDLEGVEPDMSGRMLTDALIRAERNGQPNILGFLRELPGEQASIDLSRVADVANRLKINLQDGVALARSADAASMTAGLRKPLGSSWSRQVVPISVPHRPQPLRVLTLQPASPGNGRLVVISHGLWDDPESFEGWGEVLAAQGYTVLMPDHPGSDFSQQKAMLAGDAPPPGPEELRLRPLDVSALLDAVSDGRFLAGATLNTDAVAVVGHSWGGTTSLQLAGGVPTDYKLKARCNNLKDSERNISWVLQCSWLSGVNQAAVADPRVKAVVAVSPPLRLLFDGSRLESFPAKLLLISGTRDWVVPSGPEAIAPMRENKAVRLGHRLVLVQGADHFSLRSFQGEPSPAQVGPVILGWINEQLDVDGVVTFSAGGWGDEQGSLVDVSDRL